MKALRTLGMMLLAPAIVNVCVAQSKVPVISEYLPIDKLVQGTVMKTQLDESVQPYMTKIDEAFAKLPEDQKKELIGAVKPGYPIAYDKRINLTEDEYKKYLAAWSLKKVVDVTPLVVGVTPGDKKGEWKLSVLAQNGPTPLCGFTYNAEKNEWVTPNGALAFKNDIKHTADNIYGAWTGKEWFLSKETVSKTQESLILGKSEDGKFGYLIYTLQEVNPELNMILANEVVAIRVPLLKDDPLRDKAKAAAKDKPKSKPKR